jgi:hypothetical protein
MASEKRTGEPIKKATGEPTKDIAAAEKETTQASRYAALRNHSIRFQDAIDPNAERVLDIAKSDVVFGRGKGFQNHPGNQRMRDIIDKYKMQYHSLKRSEKRMMVENVYKEIVEGGARFLKKLDDDNAWVIVDGPVALQKVSHTLRCRKNAEKLLHHSGGPKHSKSIRGRSSEDVVASGMMMNPSRVTVHNAFHRQNPVAFGFGPMASGGRGPGGPSLGFDPSTNMAAFGLPQVNGGYMMNGGGGVPPMLSGQMMGMEYYNSIRREQLLRETMLLQQMGDANNMLGSSAAARMPMAGHGTGPTALNLMSPPLDVARRSNGLYPGTMFPADNVAGETTKPTGRDEGGE